jgi:hypothetical protein
MPSSTAWARSSGVWDSAALTWDAKIRATAKKRLGSQNKRFLFGMINLPVLCRAYHSGLGHATFLDSSIKFIFGEAESRFQRDKPKVYEAGSYPVACCGELRSSPAVQREVPADIRGFQNGFSMRFWMELASRESR